MAYIYAADIYCDDCGDEIKARIQAEGKAPENPNDETSYDSDEYPKYCSDDDESDSPQHCGSHEDCLNAVTLPSGRKIGCLIGTNLTDAGVEYLKEIVDKGGEVAEFWANEFSDYLD